MVNTLSTCVKLDGGSPIALRKCSMSTAVFLTSLLYTSLPTMGQNGTLLPSSCATPSASAVLPVPGAPAQLLFCIQVWIARSNLVA